MEFSSKVKWAITIAIVVVLFFLLSWGLYSIARNVFGGGGSTQKPVEPTYDMSKVEVARYIVDGPVVANDTQRRYVVTVTRSNVRMVIYTHYGQEVLKEVEYPNNGLAFDNFISALDHSNATARYAGTDAQDDYADQGVCATGYRYILELDNDLRRWTDSCNRNDGTAAGQMTTMRRLFKEQIPNFNDFVKGTGVPQN